MRQPEPTHVLDLTACESLPESFDLWRCYRIPLVRAPEEMYRADFDVVERLLPAGLLAERRQTLRTCPDDWPLGVYVKTIPVGAIIRPLDQAVQS